MSYRETTTELTPRERAEAAAERMHEIELWRHDTTSEAEPLSSQAKALIAGVLANGIDDESIAATPEVWDEARAAFPRWLFERSVKVGDIDYEPEG